MIDLQTSPEDSVQVDSTQSNLAPDSRSDAISASASKRRLIQLDFTRGIAILMVLGYHFTTLSTPTRMPFFNALVYPFKKFGWAGVDLFFVLSGFLVGGLLIGEIYRTGSLRIGRFIKRRGFKIWPAYYFYVLFQIVTRHHPLSSFLLPNLLHLQNYLGTSLSHTWTLSLEEHFYLLLPFLLVGIHSTPRLRSHRVAVLIVICTAVLVVRTWMVFGLGSDKVWEYTHTRLDSLLFGVLLSHFYYYHRARFEALCRRRVLLGTLSAAGVAFLVIVPQTSKLMFSVGFTVDYLCFGAFLLLMVSAGRSVTNSLMYRWVAFIGVYSYGIYLWHLSVREPLQHFILRLSLDDSKRAVLLIVAEYTCAISLGVLMSRLIEWPFLRIREKVLPA